MRSMSTAAGAIEESCEWAYRIDPERARTVEGRCRSVFADDAAAAAATVLAVAYPALGERLFSRPAVVNSWIADGWSAERGVSTLQDAWSSSTARACAGVSSHEVSD